MGRRFKYTFQQGTTYPETASYLKIREKKYTFRNS